LRNFYILALIIKHLRRKSSSMPISNGIFLRGARPCISLDSALFHCHLQFWRRQLHLAQRCGYQEIFVTLQRERFIESFCFIKVRREAHFSVLDVKR